MVCKNKYYLEPLIMSSLVHKLIPIWQSGYDEGIAYKFNKNVEHWLIVLKLNENNVSNYTIINNW